MREMINMRISSLDDVMNVPQVDITLDSFLLQMMLVEVVELKIRHDGEVIWVNLGPKCVLRICGIKGLIRLEDGRNPNLPGVEQRQRNKAESPREIGHPGE